MPKRVAVVIGEDPTKTHRPVEALRIALGLCAGDHDTTVVLLGKAPLLLTDETDGCPSFAQLAGVFRRLSVSPSPRHSSSDAYPNHVHR